MLLLNVMYIFKNKSLPNTKASCNCTSKIVQKVN